jgi:hypothetical protein
MTFQELFVALAFCVLGCSPDQDGNDGAETEPGTAGTTGSSSGGESCMPGQIDACLCPDGTPSTQICLADGSDFSACDCVSATGEDDSGGSSGSGGVSGTSDDGSSDEGPADSGTGGSSTGGPPPECDGEHPLVDGELRYCEAGNCYCGDFSVEPPFDVCYVEAIAEACCPVDVVCY